MTREADRIDDLLDRVNEAAQARALSSDRLYRSVVHDVFTGKADPDTVVSVLGSCGRTVDDLERDVAECRDVRQLAERVQEIPRLEREHAQARKRLAEEGKNVRQLVDEATHHNNLLVARTTEAQGAEMRAAEAQRALLCLRPKAAADFLASVRSLDLAASRLQRAEDEGAEPQALALLKAQQAAAEASLSHARSLLEGF